ncbi:hypothetical protein C2S51_010370 [Perilla frutescens var. frutescens]|nr:hypothetical protein C2S51_010370 [Perilla frutescens var. frutescens]
MENTPLSGISSAQTPGSMPAPIITLPAQLISTKLNDSNFLLWKQQIMATIEGFGLEEFLVEKQSPPEQHVKDKSKDQVVENPLYLNWKRQDQLIISWLLSSINENMLVGVVGLSSSREIWEALESNYAGQSRARLMQLKFELQTLRKGNSTMRDYLKKIKICCDTLGAAGEKVSEDNQILHILSGLGPEYNPVMISLTSRVESPSLREVHGLLLVFENRLETMEKIGLEAVSPSMNMATQTQQSRDRTQDNFRPNNGRGRGPGSFRTNNGRGRGGRFGGNWKPRCQICHIIGHTADKCYERPNLSYSPANKHINQNGN